MTTRVRTKKKTPSLVIHATRLISVARLNPREYNPRKISDAEFAELKESIETFGFLDPIAVQKKGLGIIGGHQRVRALLDLASKHMIAPPKIPCVVIDVGDRDAMKLNVMLNNVGGEFDARKLGALLAEMNKTSKLTVQECSFMGFGIPEVDRYLKLVDAPPLLPPEPVPDTVSEFGKTVTLSLQFTDVKLRDAVKAAVVEKAKTAGVGTGQFVAELLGCKP